MLTVITGLAHIANTLTLQKRRLRHRVTRLGDGRAGSHASAPDVGPGLPTASLWHRQDVKAGLARTETLEGDAGTGSEKGSRPVPVGTTGPLRLGRACILSQEDAEASRKWTGCSQRVQPESPALAPALQAYWTSEAQEGNWNSQGAGLRGPLITP